MEVTKKEKKKKKKHLLQKLSEKAILNILSRLPVKSIFRFTCVSKAWHALIFEDSSRKLLPQAISGLFCQGYDTDVESYDIYVCNSTTKRYAMFPKPKKITNGLALAFDFHVSCDYNVISSPYYDSMVLPFEPVSFEFEVLSSKTDEWVKSKGYDGSNNACLFSNEGVFYNGVIHFIKSRYPIIVGIDLNKKLCRNLKLSRSSVGHRIRYLSKFRGCLHYALKADGKLRVWILKDYDKDLWDLKYSVSLEVLLEKAL